MKGAHFKIQSYLLIVGHSWAHNVNKTHKKWNLKKTKHALDWRNYKHTSYSKIQINVFDISLTQTLIDSRMKLVKINFPLTYIEKKRPHIEIYGFFPILKKLKNIIKSWHVDKVHDLAQ